MMSGTSQSVILPVEAARVPAEDYPDLRTRIKNLVQATVPEGTIVIVISKGDPELISFPRHMGWHFPQTKNGSYAGSYPASAEDAIAQLESLRAKGGRYLVIPAFAFWWFGYYKKLSVHLTESYRLLLRQDHTCVVFDLGRSPTAAREHDDYSTPESVQQCRELSDALLPDGVIVAVAANGNAELMKLHRQQSIAFPDDGRFGERARETVGVEDVRRDLASARRAGASFLLLPASSIAGISVAYSTALRSVLEAEHRLVTRQQYVAEIWTIADAQPPAPVAPEPRQESSEQRRKRMHWWRRK
jgi:hypothetical protein